MNQFNHLLNCWIFKKKKIIDNAPIIEVKNTTDQPDVNVKDNPESKIPDIAEILSHKEELSDTEKTLKEYFNAVQDY